MSIINICIRTLIGVTLTYAVYTETGIWTAIVVASIMHGLLSHLIRINGLDLIRESTEKHADRLEEFTEKRIESIHERIDRLEDRSS